MPSSLLPSPCVFESRKMGPLRCHSRAPTALDPCPFLRLEVYGSRVAVRTIIAGPGAASCRRHPSLDCRGACLADGADLCRRRARPRPWTLGDPSHRRPGCLCVLNGGPISQIGFGVGCDLNIRCLLSPKRPSHLDRVRPPPLSVESHVGGLGSRRKIAYFKLRRYKYHHPRLAVPRTRRVRGLG